MDAITIGEDLKTGLTKKRRFLSLEANIELEYVKVRFEDFLETSKGAVVEFKVLSYDIRNIKEQKDDGGNVTTPADNLFTNWCNKSGIDTIISDINDHLMVI